MKRVPEILVAVAIVNFAAFVLIALRIGGDAVNGKIENHHYFLSHHGVLTEVGAGVYAYSLWHARSLFLTHPIGMVAMGLLVMRLMRHLKAFR